MQNDLTDITIVLDRSGSMASVREDTIGGYNTFLEEQKAIPGSAHLTLVQFDDQYEVLYEGRPLENAPALSVETFVPRGSTALLDAIGRTLITTGARLAAQPEAERAGKVLFVIMTDGQENTSREFSGSKIFEMITHQREKYQWQIVFIGANQDALATGASYGIPQTNSMNYAASPAGTRSATAKLSAAAGRFRNAAESKSEDFFSSEEQKEA
ncbi:MAG: vWA domain-containing protein [Janthinobacterium lividum]